MFEIDLENKFIPKSKKYTRKVFANAGLNTLGKKRAFSIYGFRNKGNKQWHKNIIKVIEHLQNKGILLKGTTEKSISQGRKFLNNVLAPLMRVGLPLMKNVLTPLTKGFLIPLELTAAAPTSGAAVQKNIYGTSMATLITSNEEMKDIMKILKSLEESGLLTEGFRQAKEKI